MAHTCTEVFFLLLLQIHIFAGQDELPTKYIKFGTSNCIEYQPFTLGQGLIALLFNQGTICAAVVINGNNTVVIPETYVNRMNCTVDRTTNIIRFCFDVTMRSDSGVYQTSIVGANPKSRNGSVYVMDKPTKPTISPTTVRELTDVTLTCSSSSTSEPSPTGLAMLYNWTVDGTAPADQRYSVSNNQLSIQTVQRRDEDRVFQCLATEDNGLSSERTEISLNVTGHRDINITSLDVWPDNEVNETFPTILTCHLNTNEYEKLTWIRSHGDMNEIVQVDRGIVRSDLVMNYTKCDDFRNYTCHVSSLAGILYSETTWLQVNCKPRVQQCENGVSRVYFESDGLLNITMTVISYPSPTIVFLKEANSLYNTSLEPAIDIIHVDIYSIIRFVLKRASSDNTGKYYLLVTNYLGSSTCVISVLMKTTKSSNNQSDDYDTLIITISVIIPVTVLIGVIVFVLFRIYQKRILRQENERSPNEDREYSDIQNRTQTDDDDHRYSNLDSSNVDSEVDTEHDREYSELRSTSGPEDYEHSYLTLGTSAVRNLSVTYANTALGNQ